MPADYDLRASPLVHHRARKVTLLSMDRELMCADRCTAREGTADGHRTKATATITITTAMTAAASLSTDSGHQARRPRVC